MRVPRHAFRSGRVTSIVGTWATEKAIVMKTTSLLQLGGIAVLLSTILFGLNELIYFLFLSGQQLPVLGHWIDFFARVLFVLGLGALFARQSQRGGILGLVGYVLIVLAHIFFIGSDAVSFGVLAGVVSDEQLMQVPSYALSSSILPWAWPAGHIVFGVSVYRAQVFPKYAGALLVLVGLLDLVEPLAESLHFMYPIYMACSLVAWAWLGWILLTDKSVVSREPTPAM